MPGAPGTLTGWNELDADDGTLLPTSFFAVTAQVYAWPIDRFGTVIGLAVPVADCATPTLADVHAAE